MDLLNAISGGFGKVFFSSGLSFIRFQLAIKACLMSLGARCPVYVVVKTRGISLRYISLCPVVIRILCLS